MSKRWPQFELRRLQGAAAHWSGELRGFQRPYLLGIFFDAAADTKPYVILSRPRLRPRDGTTFEEIPHLLFWRDNPELSGLCLFDPAGNEWSNRLLIADTTMVWAADWLRYYELWHVDGVWRGGGVGPESVAEARAAALHREAIQHAQDAAGAASVAG